MPYVGSRIAPVSIADVSNNYVSSTFTSNTYLQAQGFGTGNVSNNYISGSFVSGSSVIFEANRTAGNVSSGVILWNNVLLNVGSHYNSSTGRFTAPTDGMYEFHFGGIKNNVSGVTRLNLRKNGAFQIQNRLAEGDVYNQTYITTFLSLSASDYVDVEVVAGSFYSISVNYGRFGGRLIGY